MQRITVKPRRKLELKAQLFSEAYGATIIMDLHPDQKWKITKHQHWWYLKRNGMTLRLTDSALQKLFTMDNQEE